MPRAAWLLLLLSACDDSGVLYEVPYPELQVELIEPVYGAFTGPGPARVRGVVSPAVAEVVLEGQRIPVAADGTFDVALPYEKPYRLLDLEASYNDQTFETRLPIFRGIDPTQSWPGAFGLRVTPSGLTALSGILEGLLDGFLDQIDLGNTLPPLGGNGFTLAVQALTIGSSDVQLTATDDGIVVSFELTDIVIDAEVTAEVFGNPIAVPAALTFPEVGITAQLELGVDPATGGIVVGLQEPDISLEPPEIELFGADLGFLTDLIAGQVDLEALLRDQLAGVLGNGGTFPLGGPIDFEQDIGGRMVTGSLLDLSADADGIGLSLGLGFDGPIKEGAEDVPLPTGDFDPPADIALTVHDGLLQQLLDSDLLSALDQDIQLPGFIGGFFDPLVRGLPGGEQLPENDGWCIGLRPGDAKVARFGIAGQPLVGIYLPVATVTFSIIDPAAGNACTPWLDTSLALEVFLDLQEGTVLGLDLSVPEGVIVSYGAVIDLETQEQEVIRRLGGLLESLLNLVGGFTQFDLGDILGGSGLPLDGLSLDIRGTKAMKDANGERIDGYVELGIGLTPAP